MGPSNIESSLFLKLFLSHFFSNRQIAMKPPRQDTRIKYTKQTIELNLTKASLASVLRSTDLKNMSC